MLLSTFLIAYVPAVVVVHLFLLLKLVASESFRGAYTSMAEAFGRPMLSKLRYVVLAFSLLGFAVVWPVSLLLYVLLAKEADADAERATEDGQTAMLRHSVFSVYVETLDELRGMRRVAGVTEDDTMPLEQRIEEIKEHLNQAERQAAEQIAYRAWPQAYDERMGAQLHGLELP